MKRLHELEDKQQKAVSDEAKNIKKSEGTVEALKAKEADDKVV